MDELIRGPLWVDIGAFAPLRYLKLVVVSTLSDHSKFGGGD